LTYQAPFFRFAATGSAKESASSARFGNSVRILCRFALFQMPPTLLESLLGLAAGYRASLTRRSRRLTSPVISSTLEVPQPSGASLVERDPKDMDRATWATGIFRLFFVSHFRTAEPLPWPRTQRDTILSLCVASVIDSALNGLRHPAQGTK